MNRQLKAVIAAVAVRLIVLITSFALMSWDLLEPDLFKEIVQIIVS